jgi:hypothetical protein
MNEIDELLEHLGRTLDDGFDATAPHAAGQARARLRGAIRADSPDTTDRRRGHGSPRVRGHGRWLGLLATGVAVAVALVVLAVALGIGVHRAPPTGAVPSVLPFANSVNPSSHAGVIPSSVQLAAVVRDPEGSGPAWGLKSYRVKSGMTCVQVGREQSGRIGAVGAYGSFGDDGRFHPFAYSNRGLGTCLPSDVHQHAFGNVAFAEAPASASGMQCPTIPHRVLQRLPKRARAQLTARGHAPDCQPRNQRLVAFGLLGPDATSVTYRTAHGTATTPTHGPDGAYLIVEPADPAICGTQCGYTGGVGTQMSLPVGLIATITYRDAPACHGPPFADNGATLLRLSHCRDVGYVAPPHPKVTQADLATPITVRALPGDGPFCGNDRGGAWYVCGPDEIPLEGTTGLLVLNISFTARVAVSNSFSSYTVYVQDPHNCGGSGGPLERDIRKGERVSIQETVETRCLGTFDVAVAYIPDTGPSGARHLFPRAPGAITVGTFNYRVQTVPPPTTTTPDGTIEGAVSVCCNAHGNMHESGGTIVVHGANGTQRYAYSGHAGRFSVSLPPGHYRVVGGIPRLGWKVGLCHSFPATRRYSKPLPTVTVTSSQTTAISIICQGQ